jgi:hypothetical protein
VSTPSSRRIVIVNVKRYGGKIHEIDCNWLAGTLTATTRKGRYAADPASYEEMRADQVPPGVVHCKRCRVTD